MKHAIDPRVDCVFKAILGSEQNRHLLVHFLNAILGDALAAPITTVTLLNPYNEREFADDKLSIVDVKAQDARARLYQIEIQLLNIPDLPARILYGWADLYSAQLKSGEGYEQLHPAYSIWLLGQTLRPDTNDSIHRFRLRDEHGRGLLDHGGIWLLELSKCHISTVQTEQDRWLKLFTEGNRIQHDPLPDWMNTEEMQQVMSTLKAFSEKEHAYHLYQARQNYLRQQQSIQRHIDNLTAQTEQARRDIERERAEKEAALNEKEAALNQIEQERAGKEAALSQTERERAEKEAALNEKEAALNEIERLKALLRQKT